MTRLHGTPFAGRAVLALLCGAGLPLPAIGAGNPLPPSPQSYLDQATRVRHSADRPWVPDEGRLGNLRHVQVAARDCVVRVVSGSENRVFPGTRGVVVVERSRVLDANPNEQPAPRDVVLSTDQAQACPGVGSCGVSITPVRPVTATPRPGAGGLVCFTLQLATAHDLLVGGDGLDLLVDRVRQPALRIAINPSARLRVLFDDVDLGLLSIQANAPARLGGSGKVDFLQAGSSNGGSWMLLHELRARQVGVSATTTGTRWSIRIDPGTKAGYYQPARAPGQLAHLYGIEIDGLVDRLEVPVGRVDAQPLQAATREAARSLRTEVLARAGPAPSLPVPDPAWPAATVAARALPRDARQQVADVVARHLPPSVRITEVALWKGGGRIEGMAPDEASARDVVRRLAGSGEFTVVSLSALEPRDGAVRFKAPVSFACEAPGAPSACPAGDPATPGAYSAAQVRRTLEPLLGASVGVREVSLNGATIRLKAEAPNEAEARAALDRIRQDTGMFRLSTSTYGRSSGGSGVEIDSTLKLSCTVPPKEDGICGLRSVTAR